MQILNIDDIDLYYEVVGEGALIRPRVRAQQPGLGRTS